MSGLYETYWSRKFTIDGFFTHNFVDGDGATNKANFKTFIMQPNDRNVERQVKKTNAD